MDKKYVCENCGERITFDEYKDKAFCFVCKSLSKKKRIERGRRIFEERFLAK